MRQNFVEIPGTRRIIEELRQKGFKLGLLSVHAREWINYCNRKYHYHHLFNTVLYSFQTGLSKPDPRCYELALKQLTSTASETIYIDDLEKNLIPARQLGMTTIQFSDAPQLKEQLVSLEVL